MAGPIRGPYRSMEAPVAFGEIGAPKDAGGVAGMAATVRSGGEAAAEEAEPRSRFPGLGPAVELLFCFSCRGLGPRAPAGFGAEPQGVAPLNSGGWPDGRAAGGGGGPRRVDAVRPGEPPPFIS